MRPVRRPDVGAARVDGLVGRQTQRRHEALEARVARQARVVAPPPTRVLRGPAVVVPPRPPAALPTARARPLPGTGPGTGLRRMAEGPAGTGSRPSPPAAPAVAPAEHGRDDERTGPPVPDLSTLPAVSPPWRPGLPVVPVPPERVSGDRKTRGGTSRGIFPTGTLLPQPGSGTRVSWLALPSTQDGWGVGALGRLLGRTGVGQGQADPLGHRPVAEKLVVPEEPPPRLVVAVGQPEVEGGDEERTADVLHSGAVRSPLPSGPPDRGTPSPSCFGPPPGQAPVSDRDPTSLVRPSCTRVHRRYRPRLTEGLSPGPHPDTTPPVSTAGVVVRRVSSTNPSRRRGGTHDVHGPSLGHTVNVLSNGKDTVLPSRRARRGFRSRTVSWRRSTGQDRRWSPESGWVESPRVPGRRSRPRQSGEGRGVVTPGDSRGTPQGRGSHRGRSPPTSRPGVLGSRPRPPDPTGCRDGTPPTSKRPQRPGASQGTDTVRHVQ